MWRSELPRTDAIALPTELDRRCQGWHVGPWWLHRARPSRPRHLAPSTKLGTGGGGLNRPWALAPGTPPAPPTRSAAAQFQASSNQSSIRHAQTDPTTQLRTERLQGRSFVLICDDDAVGPTPAPPHSTATPSHRSGPGGAPGRTPPPPAGTARRRRRSGRRAASARRTGGAGAAAARPSSERRRPRPRRSSGAPSP